MLSERSGQDPAGFGLSGPRSASDGRDSRWTVEIRPTDGRSSAGTERLRHRTVEAQAPDGAKNRPGRSRFGQIIGDSGEIRLRFAKMGQDAPSLDRNSAKTVKLSPDTQLSGPGRPKLSPGRSRYGQIRPRFTPDGRLTVEIRGDSRRTDPGRSKLRPTEGQRGQRRDRRRSKLSQGSPRTARSRPSEARFPHQRCRFGARRRPFGLILGCLAGFSDAQAKIRAKTAMDGLRRGPTEEQTVGDGPRFGLSGEIPASDGRRRAKIRRLGPDSDAGVPRFAGFGGLTTQIRPRFTVDGPGTVGDGPRGAETRVKHRRFGPIWCKKGR